MTRLFRRSGVLLASLGLAIGTLLVAPLGTAPAQADHVTAWDTHNYRFTKAGSWWEASVKNCFTTNLEYLKSVVVLNVGSQPHKFRFKWLTYFGQVAWDETTWVEIAANGGGHEWKPAIGTTYGALLQADHPRVKIYWVNNSGNAEVLWELHGWSPSAYDPPADNLGYNYGNCYGPSATTRGARRQKRLLEIPREPRWLIP
jgi:hypothetical protein